MGGLSGTPVGRFVVFVMITSFVPLPYSSCHFLHTLKNIFILIIADFWSKGPTTLWLKVGWSFCINIQTKFQQIIQNMIKERNKKILNMKHSNTNIIILHLIIWHWFGKSVTISPTRLKKMLTIFTIIKHSEKHGLL